MIPKIIHFCWLSGDPYPDLIHNCIASWKNVLYDYEIMIWDKERINLNNHLWVKECYENKKYAFAADYIRLYALYHIGGIYLDSDVQVIKSFNDLLDYPSFIGYEKSGDIEPAIIGSIPKMEWIGNCLSYYNERHFLMPNGNFDIIPLPLIVGEKLKYMYNIPDMDIKRITAFGNENIYLMPSEYFSPKNRYLSRIRITKNTYSVHHFDGKWVDRTFSYYMKNLIHFTLILFIGNKLHNRIIKHFRAKK